MTPPLGESQVPPVGVRAAARMPYGLLATCVDDQGVTFRLWQPTD
ncbi:MAG: hypothetical protein ACRDPY_01870 [Streptosporangiaceae bacterium]